MLQNDDCHVVIRIASPLFGQVPRNALSNYVRRKIDAQHVRDTESKSPGRPGPDGEHDLRFSPINLLALSRLPLFP